MYPSGKTQLQCLHIGAIIPTSPFPVCASSDCTLPISHIFSDSRNKISDFSTNFIICKQISLYKSPLKKKLSPRGLPASVRSKSGQHVNRTLLIPTFGKEHWVHRSHARESLKLPYDTEFRSRNLKDGFCLPELTNFLRKQRDEITTKVKHGAES